MSTSFLRLPTRSLRREILSTCIDTATKTRACQSLGAKSATITACSQHPNLISAGNSTLYTVHLLLTALQLC